MLEYICILHVCAIGSIGVHGGRFKVRFNFLKRIAHSGPRTPPPTTTRTPARATTRPSPCVPRLPRGARWPLLIAHTHGTPMGAREKSYTHVTHPPSPPGGRCPTTTCGATPPPPSTAPRTPQRGHLHAPPAYPEMPWGPFLRPTCVGHARVGLGAHTK